MKKFLVFIVALSLLYFSAVSVKVACAQDQKETQVQPAVSTTGEASGGEDGSAAGKISKIPVEGKPESFQYIITSDKNEKILIMGSKDILDRIVAIPDFEAAGFKLRGKIIKANGKTGIVANSFEVAIPGMPEGPQLKSLGAAPGPDQGKEITGQVTLSTTPVELPNK